MSLSASYVTAFLGTLLAGGGLACFVIGVRFVILAFTSARI
jgi:hypothetical protein